MSGFETRQFKPCPFCGSSEIDVMEEDLEGPRFALCCGHCGTEGPGGDTEKQAIKRWEKRAGSKAEILKPVQQNPRTVLDCIASDKCQSNAPRGCCP